MRDLQNERLKLAESNKKADHKVGFLMPRSEITWMSLRQLQVLQELRLPERLQSCQLQALQERLRQVQRSQLQALQGQRRPGLLQQELPVLVLQQQEQFQQAQERQLLLSCCKQRVQRQPSGTRSTESFS